MVVGLDGIDQPVDLVLDTVGGPQLTAAFGVLAPGGDVQAIGWASGEPAVFAPNSLFSLGRAKTITHLRRRGPPRPRPGDPARLCSGRAVVAGDRLAGPWDQIAEAAEALLGRRVAGKAVLKVT